MGNLQYKRRGHPRGRACASALPPSRWSRSSRAQASVRVVDIVQRQHDGDPKTVLAACLDGRDLKGKYLGATGRKFRRLLATPSITEPEATEYALAFVAGGDARFDAVVSAGAESFLVYQMDAKGKVSRIGSGNKCASGTGEFFLQQIRQDECLGRRGGEARADVDAPPPALRPLLRVLQVRLHPRPEQGRSRSRMSWPGSPA